jgi:hypothetical protein
MLFAEDEPECFRDCVVGLNDKEGRGLGARVGIYEGGGVGTMLGIYEGEEVGRIEGLVGGKVVGGKVVGERVGEVVTGDLQHNTPELPDIARLHP